MTGKQFGCTYPNPARHFYFPITLPHNCLISFLKTIWTTPIPAPYHVRLTSCPFWFESSISLRLFQVLCRVWSLLFNLGWLCGGGQNRTPHGSFHGRGAEPHPSPSAMSHSFSYPKSPNTHTLVQIQVPTAQFPWPPMISTHYTLLVTPPKKCLLEPPFSESLSVPIDFHGQDLHNIHWRLPVWGKERGLGICPGRGLTVLRRFSPLGPHSPTFSNWWTPSSTQQIEASVRRAWGYRHRKLSCRQTLKRATTPPSCQGKESVRQAQSMLTSRDICVGNWRYVLPPKIGHFGIKKYLKMKAIETKQI